MNMPRDTTGSGATNEEGLCWYFPSTNHGENHGFADSLLEYFQGDHERYIAREAIQNSVDAQLDPNVPVTVVFEKYSIPATEMPGHAQLLDTVQRCLSFVSGQDKAENFFKSAISLLKGDSFDVLKISDFNTRGLTGGDDEVNGNWYRLVRAAGTSSPKGVAGGSFGIGKGAPFAASAIRTVFYSSVNDKDEIVCQGKSRLVSHHDKQNDVRQGIGFFGVDGYKAIRNATMVPTLFNREERGTDIFIMGYRSGNDWQQKLIKSVLDNFWYAIYGGGLVVVVKDSTELVISKENLEECLLDYGTQDALHYYETVVKPTQFFEKDLKNLGRVELYVRKDDAFSSRVMMARKPKMLVQEKGYRALREPYAGVFVCEDDRGNTLLRDLEPPAHDKWDPARADNGQTIMRELDTFVKLSLKSMAESITSEPQDIPGLSAYLPDSDERDYLPSAHGDDLEESGTSSDKESGREIGKESSGSAPVEKVTRKGFVTNKQAGGVVVDHPTSGGSGTGRRSGGVNPGDVKGNRINTMLISFRSFVQRTEDGYEYHFAITGKENCSGSLRIVAVGDDGNYPVAIESVLNADTGQPCEVSDSSITGLDIQEGKTSRFIVRLSHGRKYALGIESYES